MGRHERLDGLHDNGGREMSEAPEDLRDLEQMHQDWLNAPTLSDAMQLPEVQALVEALERIAHASDFYGVEANAEDQGAGTLAYAHKSTCNLARAALAPFTEAKP